MTYKAFEYFVNTAPANSVLALQDVKDFLRIDFNDDDAIVTRISEAVVQLCEAHTRKTLLKTSFVTYRDEFEDALSLRKSPYNADDDVVVEYLVSGVWTPLTINTDFIVINSMRYAYLYTQTSWPTEVDNRPQAIRITFSAGYGDLGVDVPSGLRQAMLEHCAFLYENRGDDSKNRMDIPPQVYSQYKNFRVVEFA